MRKFLASPPPFFLFFFLRSYWGLLLQVGSHSQRKENLTPFPHEWQESGYLTACGVCEMLARFLYINVSSEVTSTGDPTGEMLKKKGVI